MSDKEKTLVEQLKELPADIQDKFLLMAQGAAVAVDCAKAREEKDEEDGDPLIRPCGESSTGGR